MWISVYSHHILCSPWMWEREEGYTLLQLVIQEKNGKGLFHIRRTQSETMIDGGFHYQRIQPTCKWGNSSAHSQPRVVCPGLFDFWGYSTISCDIKSWNWITTLDNVRAFGVSLMVYSKNNKTERKAQLIYSPSNHKSHKRWILIKDHHALTHFDYRTRGL